MPMRDGVSREFLALDLETTGLAAGHDRVVEIGAVRFDGSGRELARFERLVNPGRAMPRAAQAVHGLSDADLAGAPSAHEVLPEFLEFLGDPGATTLLAHNAWFDAGFLGRELARVGRSSPGHTVTDTLALARRRLPHLRNHRLDTLANALGLDPDGPHRALADSLRVMGLWLALHGPAASADELLAYPICDDGAPTPDAPAGWDLLAEAIVQGRRVRMGYSGGSRGDAPREVTPRAFLNRGGMPYLVALCHLDALEKTFRLDRVVWYEVIP
jgi:DNA polymerase III epsilon subunit family exonuclease